MILSRFAYTPTETQGRLIIGDWSCFTIERPWVRGEHRGGKPFESCVPDGEYELVRYDSSRGYEVFCLINPSLGVYLHESDIPEYEGGRFMIQIHIANYADQLEGCIAPGRKRVNQTRGVMVTHSGDTFEEMMHLGSEERIIRIQQAPGAIDAPLH